jgi:hypothetical protein
MNSQNLLNSLTAQEKNLDSLYLILETMKKSIVQNDLKTFEQTIGEEQIILKKIKSEDDNRKKIMIEMVDSLALETKAQTLENILSAGKTKIGKEYDALQKAHITLKGKLKKISHMNIVLREIIEISRNFIKETMMVIAGQKRHGLINRRVF